MHLDKVSYVIVGLVLASDKDGMLTGITPSEDPDNVPDNVPCGVYSFIPTPFNDVFDEFLAEVTFWFDNPSLREISKIIDNMEKGSGNQQWYNVVEDGLAIGKYQYLFVRSPSSGGRQSLRFVTLFLKVRAFFNQDQC
jgi:hypothetical protein